MRRVLILGFWLVAAGAAQAQQQADRTRTVSAVAGQEVRIGSHARYDKRCQPLAPPSIAVLQPPANGTLTTRPGTEIAGNGFGSVNCKGREVSGVVVFYQPRPGFHGQDGVRYQVEYAGGGVLNSVTIQVQ